MVMISSMMGLAAEAFVVPPPSPLSTPTTAARTTTSTVTLLPPLPSQSHFPISQHHLHHLRAFVADRVDHEEAFDEKKRKRDRDRDGTESDEDNVTESAWRPSKNGGFIPNLKAKAASSIRILRRVPTTTSPSSFTTSSESTDGEPTITITSGDDDDDDDNNYDQEIFRRVQLNEDNVVLSSSSNDDVDAVITSTAPSVPIQTKEPLKIWTVDDIQGYKEVVADESDKIVVVRFYAPWCRACRAIQSAYRSLPKHYDPDQIKFVEVPVTKDNTYLHRGLGVPSLPYGHIYHPTGGLVEEMKISKRHFGNFQHILGEYVDGQCQVEYGDEDGDGATCRRMSSSSSSRSSRSPPPSSS